MATDAGSNKAEPTINRNSLKKKKRRQNKGKVLPYGFYSKEHVEKQGYIPRIYESLDRPGTTVEVTHVAITPEPSMREYGWEDKRCVGQVGKLVKGGGGTSSRDLRRFGISMEMEHTMGYLDTCRPSSF